MPGLDEFFARDYARLFDALGHYGCFVEAFSMERCQPKAQRPDLGRPVRGPTFEEWLASFLREKRTSGANVGT